jgi:hypothetical protein
MSIRKQATETAIDVIDGVVRTVADIRESREAEPEYWAAFHTDRVRSLPRWRWLARAHHQRMAGRYLSFVRAKRIAR